MKSFIKFYNFQKCFYIIFTVQALTRTLKTGVPEHYLQKVGSKLVCRSRDRELDPNLVSYFVEIGHEILYTH